MMFLSILLLAVVSLAQHEDDGIDIIQEKSEEEKYNELMAEKQKKEMDTTYYTCIVLSRIQLGNYGDELLKIIKSQESAEDQTNVWKKLYTGHAQTCADHINYEESVSIMTSIRQQDFDYKRLPPLFSDFDFNLYRTNQWSREFTELEHGLWRYIEEFESAMAENSQKKQADQEREREREDLEELEYLKMAAQQSRSTPRVEHTPIRHTQQTNSTDIIFLLVAFTAIGFGLYVAYLKLSIPNDGDLQRKQKKQK